MKLNYDLHVEDWTNGNANTFLNRVNNSRRNKNKVYKVDQDLCNNKFDVCDFDFTAAATPREFSNKFEKLRNIDSSGDVVYVDNIAFGF